MSDFTFDFSDDVQITDFEYNDEIGDVSLMPVIIVPQEFNTDSKTITANGTYSAEDDNLDGYNEVTVNVPAGLTTIGRYNKIKTGTVTYTNTLNNNGDDVIAYLEDIGFTPKLFFCMISAEDAEDIATDLINGDKANACWSYCSYVCVEAGGEIADMHRRQTCRITTSGLMGGPAISNASWTGSTNDYIKITSTYVAFRRTQGYGHYADSTYEWYAFG